MKFTQHVDPHIAVLLLILIPLVTMCVMAIGLVWFIGSAVVFVFPQGIILTRCADLRSRQSSPALYFAVDEFVVTVATTFVALAISACRYLGGSA